MAKAQPKTQKSTAEELEHENAKLLARIAELESEAPTTNESAPNE